MVNLMRKVVALSLFAFLVGTGTVLVTEQPAQAQVVRVQVAPPVVVVETIPAAPSSAHVWIHGHWRWDGSVSRHVWVPGRYEAPPAAGHIWYPHRWMHDGSAWVFVPGRWAAPSSAPTVEVTTAPPVVQVETVGRPPSANHFWVGGHWRWDGGRHVWTPGYWEVRRHAQVWEPAHWQFWGGRWRFVAGHWRTG
jgi:hypothetical protein